MGTAGSPMDKPSKTSSTAYGIVALSHLRWNFVWQRPQQFLSRFAKDQPVLFIEEPDYRLPEGSEPSVEITQPDPNITVVTPALARDLRDTEQSARAMLHIARKAIQDAGFDRPLLWVYSPTESAWALGELDVRGVVYDCMDELSHFLGAPKQLVEDEKRLMEASDVVFCGGHELWLSKSQKHPNCHFFGCGVEYDHFAQAQDSARDIPNDLKNLNAPVVGWFGVVDERMDLDLLAQLAKTRPNYEFVIVGPVVKIDPSTLPKAKNIHWLGGRDYKVLPDYCRAFDVCMMPFAINDATKYINPTKALEYLATGKPVVSTPVADVTRQYSDTISIATTAEDFAGCIDRGLESPDRKMIDKGIALAKENSWERTVANMREIIAESLGQEVTNK